MALDFRISLMVRLMWNLFGSKEASRGSILYSYKHGFSGFAAVLTRAQAKLIAGFLLSNFHKNVRSCVFSF